MAGDAGGLFDGYDQAGTWTISGNGHPSTVSVDPASVADTSGVERVFTTVFSDPNGFKNLSFVTLRLGGSGTGSTTNNADVMLCVYNVQRNKLYLFNDVGSYDSRNASFPGRTAVLENSGGNLNCSRTTVTGSGSTLTVKWSVKAKAAFAGSRSLALLCADRANLRDGYDMDGTWMITNPRGVPATAKVSTATASGMDINLVFTGATPPVGYAVTVNGASVEVTSASILGGKVQLSLALPLHAGDQVVVTWPQGSTALTAS